MTGPKLCECGCGSLAPVMTRTRSTRGQVKGQALRFISGHHNRLPEYRQAAGRRLSKPGPSNSQWKGGRSLHSAGYRRIHMPNHPCADVGYVLEHRLVMERLLGRYLAPGEVVHHIDGDKLNNDPGNLQLMSPIEHLKLHAELRRAS